MSEIKHTNLIAYDDVEQLVNFTEKSFNTYCDEKIKSCKKHIIFFKNLFSSKKKLKICEIGSGNSKLLYALEKENMLKEGIGIEISKSRYVFAEKFKKYTNSLKVKNINKNLFDINPMNNFDIIIGVDIVMQLISPVSKDYEKNFLKWSYDSLNERGGVLVLELLSFKNILKQLELSDANLNLWEEFPESDPFEFMLSKIYLNDSHDICWDKIFLKRNSTKKSLFNNILRPYSKVNIEKLLIKSGFEDIKFFEKWANENNHMQDEYIVTAIKKENK